MVRDNKGTASMGLAGKLYLKRSNYGAFYKDSLSMSQLKLPNIPMPGYAGVCAGVDRREIGCARTFGRFMPIHQIPKTADMMFEEDDSFLSRGFGPNGKHRNGHETYSVTEGALEADNLKIPPLDESELARRERRLNRIAGTSKRAPYLQRASNDDAVTHIDADYRASPDYKSFHQFPPTSDKVSYAPGKKSKWKFFFFLFSSPFFFYYCSFRGDDGAGSLCFRWAVVAVTCHSFVELFAQHLSCGQHVHHH